MSDAKTIRPKSTRAERDLRAHLRNLTAAVRSHIAQLDALMPQPPTPERGRQIAALCNELQLANDIAVRFGLGKR